MEYPTKIKVLLGILSIVVNVVIVGVWGYYYVYYPSLLTSDVHVLMAWLLSSTAIGMVALSVQLYSFLLRSGSERRHGLNSFLA
jgi:hypothetical protein